MNLVIPEACDAYYRALVASPDLVGVTVFDGPAALDAGDEGIAVAATREDVAATFAVTASDMASDGANQVSIASLVWVRTGDTTFSTARARASQLFRFAAAALAADRTLGGAVSTAWVTGGNFHQEQSGKGALVVVEFRIEGTLF